MPKRRKKKKGKGKKKSGAGSSRAVAEEVSEGSEDEGEPKAQAPEAQAEAKAAHGDTECWECPICLKEEPEIARASFVQLPCAGRHAVCRGCLLNWQLTNMKQGTECSCPMCRECIEGWEPPP